MSDIENLINQAFNKDYNAAGESFVDIMNQKMSDALEQEKIRMANSIYNDAEEDDEDLDDEDLDLDDDEDIVDDDDWEEIDLTDDDDDEED